MEEIKARLKQIYPLSDEAHGKLAAKFRQIYLPKGSILVKEGSVASNVYLLEKGIARAYFNKDGKEITFWLGAEGFFIISYNGYIADKPGYSTIELLEDTSLFTIDHQTIRALFRADLELANWGRRLAEQELIKTEQLVVSTLFKTAQEKYQDLMQQHPEWVQRVQLGHIASYLGVTQVTLSRIRTKTK